MIYVPAVDTGRYVNLQVANSGDDRSKVSRRGWSKAICRKSISEGKNTEGRTRRLPQHSVHQKYVEYRW